MLRSDPSIECYNGDHWLAFTFSVLVLGVCAVATPLVLFRTIRAKLLEQEARHGQVMAEGAGELTAEEEAAYTAAFKRYDADRSGEIDDTELGKLLEEKVARPACV